MLQSDRGLILALVLALFSTAAFAADLAVEDARLRLLPGDLPGAGYFRISNEGSESRVLTGVETAAFERVMMHESLEEDGMMRMRHMMKVELEPGAQVEFAPRGYHLMFMKRTRDLSVGDKVEATLKFADGQRLPVVFQVVSPTAR